ncbi:MAG TPA: hypothetical protein VIG64_10670 [Actinomycetota bacterium]|jgi:hypothetical protein
MTLRSARVGAALVGALALTAVVPVSSSSGAALPGAEASVEQFAYATSILHEDGRDYMYVAGAQRATSSNGRTRTVAFAKKARCLSMKTKRIKLIACAAFINPRRVPDGAFEFDPLLGSSDLRFRQHGRLTSMSWEGRGTPEPDAGPYADLEFGGGANASLYRAARARGKILDERYPPRRYGFALLVEGADAFGYTSRELTITRARGGAIKVEALYRIPR